jgi:endonuclease YncB( thermonuclease family)
VWAWWQGGPPPEKQITLAGIQGPRLGRRDGVAKDEPFAWAAREFVRNLCIGKPCTFEIEDSAANRVFGHINVEGENVASKIVAAGWAKVKPMGNNASASKGAYVEELLQVCPPVVLAASALPNQESVRARATCQFFSYARGANRAGRS